MVAGYNSMKDAIPELVSWSMGSNLRGDSEFTHSMVAIVEDPEALKRYVDHPLHHQVSAELGRPIFEKRVIGPGPRWRTSSPDLVRRTPRRRSPCVAIRLRVRRPLWQRC